MKKSNGDSGKVFNYVPFSDRVWLFFQNNRKSLATIAAVVMLSPFAFFLWKFYTNLKVARMQKAYVSLGTLKDEENFVKKYGDQGLAGAVALRIGDKYFGDGNFAAAKESYERAGKILRNGVVFPRAEIGRAVAEYGLGNLSDAQSILTSVIHEGKFDKAFRGEAAYVLAAMLKDSGDSAKLKTFSEKIETLDVAPIVLDEIRYVVGNR
jgi:tetratricopeptide (TPR) repeat protein